MSEKERGQREMSEFEMDLRNPFSWCSNLSSGDIIS